jgi:hypothetical protein
MSSSHKLFIICSPHPSLPLRRACACFEIFVLWTPPQGPLVLLFSLFQPFSFLFSWCLNYPFGSPMFCICLSKCHLTFRYGDWEIQPPKLTQCLGCLIVMHMGTLKQSQWLRDWNFIHFSSFTQKTSYTGTFVHSNHPFEFGGRGMGHFASPQSKLKFCIRHAHFVFWGSLVTQPRLCSNSLCTPVDIAILKSI